MIALIAGLAAIAGALVLMGRLLFAGSDAAAQPATVIGAPGGARPRMDTGKASRLALHRRAAVLGGWLSRSDYARRAQARLDLAGNPSSWTTDRLLTAKGYGLVAGVGLGLLIGAKHGGLFTVLTVLLVGALGLYLPDFYVRNRAEHRQLELQKGLPDAMDMMTVCVEAGLGFDAALVRVARNLEGPMAEECARVLQEMQFGMSRSEALRSLQNRTKVAELRSFVTSIVQSSELGISIGDVLREQAKQMRVKRRHRAEEKAQKLQVKLLFPLIFCLLPAMFIVILGPAAIDIAGFFGKATK